MGSQTALLTVRPVQQRAINWPSLTEILLSALSPPPANVSFAGPHRVRYGFHNAGMNVKKTIATLTMAAAVWTQPTEAHVTLDVPQAPADSYYKGVFRLSHGCGTSPTVRVRVRIPDGVLGAKPQPKPGWTLAVTRVKLAKPVEAAHGRSVAETVSEVSWSGGSLANEYFDEFSIMMKLPDRPGTTLYFPVVQDCREGGHRWIEVPAPGRPEVQLKEPAPALRLTPRQ